MENTVENTTNTGNEANTMLCGVKILKLKQISQVMFCGHCITKFEDADNNIEATRITREFNTVNSWIKFKGNDKSFQTTDEFCEYYGFKNGGVIYP